jgi:hypothetical protein
MNTQRRIHLTSRQKINSSQILRRISVMAVMAIRFRKPKSKKWQKRTSIYSSGLLVALSSPPPTHPPTHPP